MGIAGKVRPCLLLTDYPANDELALAGRLGWTAFYLKEVDSLENTIRFWQEIYDERNVLREIHEKFPIDRGHHKF